MGLVVLGALAIYVVVLVAVTWFAYRWAAKRGLPRGKRWLAAAGGFLVVYLPAFWDHIPTLVAHNYYCEKEAGFWQYRTVEQWKAENSGIAETLTWREIPIQPDTITLPDGTNRYILNERFVSETHQRRLSLLPVTVWRSVIRDRKTEDIMAKLAGVGSGYGNLATGGEDWHVLKFWLALSPCPSSPESLRFSKLSVEIRLLGEKR